ncbi:cytosolic sulfotransferase 15-like [Andrographis paniculata]|uniref:cytosolic sulfotransferase 15-like n=1 Tax=Andrographis paniculata TaxID=175694 RepID=UPI0021E78139|nr:cytosolic sulfotransferase 15-like [Andrographis paniculata]
MEKSGNPKSLCSRATADNFVDQQTNWYDQILGKYGGTWYSDQLLRSILSARSNFKAKEGDVMVTSLPKSGTTWLLALTFSIAKRSLIPPGQSPLLTANPHDLACNLEFKLYWEEDNPNLDGIPCPRIFSTHVPHVMLPDSVRESDNCRIIYICRNPLDRFISLRHFLLANRVVKEAAAPPPPLAMDEAFNEFCQGIEMYGPFWEHVLGYWKEHLENPRKLLFLHYEEMKEDPVGHVRKIAEFLGCPFTAEEEKQGMVDEISRLCSFESMKNMEANKEGYVYKQFKKTSFFREGKVHNWSNYLSPTIAKGMEKVIEAKFKGSGLNMKTRFQIDKEMN